MCVLAPQYTNVIFMLTMKFSISRVVDEIMTKCNYILASAVLTESITQRCILGQPEQYQWTRICEGHITIVSPKKSWHWSNPHDEQPVKCMYPSILHAIVHIVSMCSLSEALSLGVLQLYLYVLCACVCVCVYVCVYVCVCMFVCVCTSVLWQCGGGSLVRGRRGPC